MKKRFRFIDNFLIREKLLTIIGSFLLVNLAFAATISGSTEADSISLLTPPVTGDSKDIRVRTQEGTENHINYFRLILKTPPSVDATVKYKTRDGSAIAGQDYIETSGTATIRAGETEALIGVEIIADTEIEGDETFDLVITNPQNGKFSSDALEIVQTHTIAGVNNNLPTDNTEVTDKFMTSENPIADQYIVVLKDNFSEISTLANQLATSATALKSVDEIAKLIVNKYNATLQDVYKDSIQGFLINVDEEQAKKIANEAVVNYVIEDGEIKLDDPIQNNNTSGSATIDSDATAGKITSSRELIKGQTQPLANGHLTATPETEEIGLAIGTNSVYTNATWGLDRIDQCGLPLNNTYTTQSNNGGDGVHTYVIDTGINQSHPDFTVLFGNGFTAISDGNGTSDCNGHGTHVAGTIGSQTWGVAKHTILHPIRVLNCSGYGTISGVLGGINWVSGNYTAPAVANMSLGGGVIPVIDDAVRAGIKKGITFVLAAGNRNKNACNYSPARTREAITVGAIAQNDSRSFFSNIGSCVDVFAPGSNITSTWLNGATNTISGTSMAAPHVTGMVALYLEKNPTATPAMATSTIMSQSIVDVISNVGTDSPNLLAHSLTTERKPFFRYYNTFHGAHLYTTDWNELNAAGIGAWKYESTEGYLTDYIPGVTIPLYRYYSATPNNYRDYFYTVDWAGYNLFNQWYYNGIAGYVPINIATDTTNFYRYLNAGHHFYTTNFNELGNGQNGWNLERIESQVYSQRVCTPSTSTPKTWELLSGRAKDIGVGGTAGNENTWIIGTNSVAGGYGIYYRDGNSWTSVSGGAVRIDVDPSGNPWVVNSNGNIYKRVGNNWQQLSGLAKDIGIGADGTVWIIGTNSVAGGYGIYYRDGNSWTSVSGGAVRIDVDPSGNPWVVNSNGNIYKRVGNNWQQLSGLAKDIGIGADGTVWIIGTNSVVGGYGIYYRDGNSWMSISGGATQISADNNGDPWVVNSTNKIYHYY